MKLSVLVIGLVLTSVTGLALVGTAFYRWLTEVDKVFCVANAYSFGCTTTLGWLLTGAGAVAVAGAAYAWERFHGE